MDTQALQVIQARSRRTMDIGRLGSYESMRVRFTDAGMPVKGSVPVIS